MKTYDYEVVPADDWYGDCAPECLGISAETADEELEEIARKDEREAEADGYTIADAEEYLRRWRAVYRLVKYVREHGMPSFGDIPCPTSPFETAGRFLRLRWELTEGVIITTQPCKPYPGYITVVLENERGDDGWVTIGAWPNTTLGHKAAVISLIEEVMERYGDEDEA